MNFTYDQPKYKKGKKHYLKIKLAHPVEVFQRVIKNVKETVIIATEIDEDMALLLEAYEGGRISLDIMRLILFASIATANEQITSMELSI